jgi:DNA polymerase-3 subunit epsilon
MLLIQNASLVAIDFESTGERSGLGALPIQVGMASLERLTILPETFFRSYLQVRNPVSKGNRVLSKIADAPTLLSLWPTFEERLRGRCLVAHGRGTEKRFLRAFPMHGFGPWIDTLTLTRTMVPGLPSYQLSDLLLYFGLVEHIAVYLPDFRWHEALSDALASLLLLLHLIKKGNLSKEPISFLIS